MKIFAIRDESADVQKDLAIGGNHFIHAIRRNVDITILLVPDLHGRI